VHAPRGSASLRRLRRARRRRRVRQLPPRPAPLQGVRVGPVGAIVKLAGGHRPLLLPSRGVGLAGCGSLRLEGARPAGRHARADCPLVLSGRASCLTRARAHLLSRAAACGCHDYDTSAPQGGDDEDDPDMSLQSTTALATSPLHDGLGDGSSPEETPSSPAFCLLMRFSLQSRLAIWRFLCCALCVACLFFAAALFWLKIASSGRGALQLQWQEGMKVSWGRQASRRSMPR
jgi:hypothetical protein